MLYSKEVSLNWWKKTCFKIFIEIKDYSIYYTLDEFMTRNVVKVLIVFLTWKIDLTLLAAVCLTNLRSVIKTLKYYLLFRFVN